MFLAIRANDFPLVRRMVYLTVSGLTAEQLDFTNGAGDFDLKSASAEQLRN